MNSLARLDAGMLNVVDTILGNMAKKSAGLLLYREGAEGLEVLLCIRVGRFGRVRTTAPGRFPKASSRIQKIP